MRFAYSGKILDMKSLVLNDVVPIIQFGVWTPVLVISFVIWCLSFGNYKKTGPVVIQAVARIL